jgi:hypothetical protein
LQYREKSLAAAQSRPDRKSGRLGRSARVALALVLVSTLGVGAAVEGGPIASAMAAVVGDPGSIFAKRSPGRRGGFLQQTKIKPASRTEHASGKPKPPPVAGDFENTPTPVTDEDVTTALAETIVPPGGPVSTSTPGFEQFTSMPPPESGQIYTSGGGGGTYPSSFGPGGGGGGGGGNELSTAVPEPSIWAMLFAGFFSVGLAMRYQRRRERLTPVRVPAHVTGR